MEARRPSLISNVSIRQRKYSTDRVLRQAELSARLEEGRPINLVTTQIEEGPEDTVAEKLEHHGIKTLTRADTLISPFDVHPGQRVNSFPFGFVDGAIDANGVNTGFDWGVTKPWKEPTAAEEEDIERRAAVIGRTETASLDLTRAQSHIYGSLAGRQNSSNSVWRLSLWKKQPNRKVRDPSVISGLHIAAAMHTEIGLRLIAQKSPDWVRRQHLHILEYSTGKSASFSCDANNSYPSTEALKQHLLEATNPMRHLKEANSVRLIHIRNNVEAFRYMDQAFAISSAEIHYGERGFREWMEENRDSRRASNMTIRWRPGFDTNRQITCMALGIDLGPSPIAELWGVKSDDKPQPENHSFRKRRIAVYIQRSPSKATPHPSVTQFNSRGHAFSAFAKQDNIVVCEYSSDAWGEISNTPSLLALGPVAGVDQNGSAAVMASVMGYIFWEIVAKWQSQIAAIHQPFADLEDQIYAEPSDISHSNQVWEWSRHLHSMLKLAVRHLKVIQDFQDDFASFAELDDRIEWLDDVLKQMKRVADTIREDYIEPLEHMIDLIYKSVTIRDSRLSLELGTSLWRLSWITFIFLPLTFLVGFFGMNVDVFRDDPSIKWYFVACVPLTFIIIGFWYVFNRYSHEHQSHEASRKRHAE